ncbi:MAG: acyl-CoA reductase [Bacteroidetes bacterium]|nr:acyl-CoA reductase [Bacteroidota bacterium]
MNNQNFRKALADLGEEAGRISEVILTGNEYLGREAAGHLFKVARHARDLNPWFTLDNVAFSLKSWSEALCEESVNKWLDRYQGKVDRIGRMLKVGVIMAGNIPLVGLHDALCVLASGHKLIARTSTDDAGLTRAILELLISFDSSLNDRICFAEGKLQDFDCIIATGSTNTSRYFEYYFRNVPKIIRKNRNSVAIVRSGDDDFEGLGEDIFRYFGLGCRNVSLLFVPKETDIGLFMANFSRWSDVQEHTKYMNNYQYYKALYLLNRDVFFDNGFFMMKPSATMISPVGTVHYMLYEDISEVNSFLGDNHEKIQCIVDEQLLFPGSIRPGTTQFPALWDYADGVDTMEFLLNRN